MGGQSADYWTIAFGVIASIGTLVSIGTALFVVSTLRRQKIEADSVELGREVVGMTEFAEKVERIATALVETAAEKTRQQVKEIARSVVMDQCQIHLNRNQLVSESQHRNDIRVITDRMDRLESRMERLPLEVASRVENALTGVNSTLQNVLLELRGTSER